MIELTPDAYGYNIHTDALTAALRTVLTGKVAGVSTYGPARSISIFLEDSADEVDETAALVIAAQHDPVLLSVDKLTIAANGIDAATVTVRAPKPGAAAVMLQVSINGSAPADWGPIALTGGVGSDTLTSVDQAAIAVTVKNGSNRSTDQLTIIAR